MRHSVSGEAAARKIYEDRVLQDVLTRLRRRLGSNGLPLSDEELKTLARRSRESFRNPEKKRERLERYKAPLARTHGADVVTRISAALKEINNEIGDEEK